MLDLQLQCRRKVRENIFLACTMYSLQWDFFLSWDTVESGLKQFPYEFYACIRAPNSYPSATCPIPACYQFQKYSIGF